MAESRFKKSNVPQVNAGTETPEARQIVDDLLKEYEEAETEHILEDTEFAEAPQEYIADADTELDEAPDDVEIYIREDGVTDDAEDSEEPYDELEQFEMKTFIPKEEDTEPYIVIPTSDLKRLFVTNNVLPVMVHGTTISINLDEFQKISDANPDSVSTINALSATLENQLSAEEVVRIRDKQMFSFKTGASIMEDVTSVMDTSSLKVIVPKLLLNLEIEDSNIEGLDVNEKATMISVKPEYKEQVNGLSKILKKNTVVTILNMMQEEGPVQELRFYANVLDNMKESNTANLTLMLMRGMMQYALNTDTIKLQTVLTDMVLNQEGI